MEYWFQWFHVANQTIISTEQTKINPPQTNISFSAWNVQPVTISGKMKLEMLMVQLVIPLCVAR
jgi:hypothetical protein